MQLRAARAAAGCAQGHAKAAAIGLVGADRFGNHGVKIHCAGRQRGGTGFDLGQVEHIIDQP